MARPRLEIGTAGRPTLTPQTLTEDGRWVTTPDGAKPDRWRARVRYRDSDGVLRDVERIAATRGRAETAIRAAVRDRTEPRAGDLLRATTTLRDAGEAWLAQVERDDALAATTRTQYARTWRRYVEGSTFADLTLAEANRVPQVRSFLQRIADDHGTGAAKSTRSVVSLVLGMAVHDGVLDVNAARQVRSPKQAPAKRDAPQRERDTRRALTEAERAHLVAVTRADEGESGHLRRGDVADLVAFLAAVGPRLGEALAVRWEGISWTAGTVHVPGTKTEASNRTLRVADWLLDILHARWIAEGRPSAGFVFHSTLGGLEDARDQRAAARSLRRALDRAGFPWATPHTLRRTVATLLDAAGVPLVQIADYLGHSDPAVTARVYLGRGGDTSRAASVL